MASDAEAIVLFRIDPQRPLKSEIQSRPAGSALAAGSSNDDVASVSCKLEEPQQRRQRRSDVDEVSH